MINMNLLEVKNLDKSFDNKEVLKNINFSISTGKIIGLLGKNGAGKSTLIKIMTGLIKPDHGKVYYEGLELTSNINRIRKNIGNYFN